MDWLAKLQALQAVIDIAKAGVRLKGLGQVRKVPMKSLNGHLAVKITSFPEHVHTFHEVWSQLGMLSDEDNADVELIRIPQELKQSNSQPDFLVNNAKTTSMAPSLATNGHSVLRCRDAAGTCDGASSAPEDSQPRVAWTSGPTLDGRKDQAPEESHQRMRAQPNPEVRKQTWPLQQVPGMRKEMDLGRRKQPMGGALAKAVATAAFTVLFHGNQLPGSQIHTGFDNLFDLGTTAKTSFQEGDTDRDNCQTQVICGQERGHSAGGIWRTRCRTPTTGRRWRTAQETIEERSTSMDSWTFACNCKDL